MGEAQLGSGAVAHRNGLGSAETKLTTGIRLDRKMAHSRRGSASQCPLERDKGPLRLLASDSEATRYVR